MQLVSKDTGNHAVLKLHASKNASSEAPIIRGWLIFRNMKYLSSYNSLLSQVKNS